MHGIANILFSEELTTTTNQFSIEISFLLSLAHVMVKKALFLCQIFKMVILMNMHFMRSPEFENERFSIWFVMKITQK